MEVHTSRTKGSTQMFNIYQILEFLSVIYTYFTESSYIADERKHYCSIFTKYLSTYLMESSYIADERKHSNTFTKYYNVFSSVIYTYFTESSYIADERKHSNVQYLLKIFDCLFDRKFVHRGRKEALKCSTFTKDYNVFSVRDVHLFHRKFVHRGRKEALNCLIFTKYLSAYLMEPPTWRA